MRLKYSNPMYLDDVAVDFPAMPIVLAHPSFPWQDEAISVALHKPSVHIDLSGWSPKYFPPNLVQYANTLLRHKVMFGSDYPMITPDRWLADFERLDIRPEVRPLILKWNAARLLGLAPPAGLSRGGDPRLAGAAPDDPPPALAADPALSGTRLRRRRVGHTAVVTTASNSLPSGSARVIQW